MQSFANWWELPFLNQPKGENDCRKDFIVNLNEKMVLDWSIKPETSRLLFRHASDWATRLYWCNTADEYVHEITNISGMPYRMCYYCLQNAVILQTAFCKQSINICKWNITEWHPSSEIHIRLIWYSVVYFIIWHIFQIYK